MATIRSHDRGLLQRALVGVMVSTLLLAACGNSGDEDEATGDDPSGAETSTTEGGQTVEGNGVFEPIEGVPGVTDDAINIALLSTGPSNPLGYCLLDCVADGLEAYFAFRNDQGGVNGRDLVLSETVDDEVANNQVRALELTQDQDVFAVANFPVLAAGMAELASAGIPTYTNAVASGEAEGNETVFPWSGVACRGCPGRASVYLASVAGASRVASLGYGVSDASKSCVEGQVASFDEWGADAGIEHVYAKADLPYGLPNGLGPEVTAMKQAGVDFVLTCIDQSGALALSQELERQDMGSVPIVLPQGYADTTFLSANAELLEGDFLSLLYRPLEADAGASLLDELVEWVDETGGQMADYTIQGWIVGEMIFQGILNAGPQFDRASVVAATNAMTDLTSGGMHFPVDWTVQHEAATPGNPITDQSCFAAVRVAGGEFEVVGDAAAPWFCWDNDDLSWSEPESTDFE